MTRKTACRMHIYMAYIAPLFPLFVGKFPINSNYLIFSWAHGRRNTKKILFLMLGLFFYIFLALSIVFSFFLYKTIKGQPAP